MIYVANLLLSTKCCYENSLDALPNVNISKLSKLIGNNSYGVECHLWIVQLKYRWQNMLNVSTRTLD